MTEYVESKMRLETNSSVITMERMTYDNGKRFVNVYTVVTKMGGSSIKLSQSQVNDIVDMNSLVQKRFGKDAE